MSAPSLWLFVYYLDFQPISLRDVLIGRATLHRAAAMMSCIPWLAFPAT